MMWRDLKREETLMYEEKLEQELEIEEAPLKQEKRERNFL